MNLETNHIKSQGFTLIEVILSLVILVSLSMGAVNVIQNTLNLKTSLADEVKVTQNINNAMVRVVHDLQHTFIIHTRRIEYNSAGRATKSIFHSNDKTLQLTSMVRRPMMKDSGESDQTFIVYELRDDKDNPGRKDLYRGESKVIPKDLEQEIPMVILAKGVKEFSIMPWTGDRWHKTRWHSNRSDFRNTLPGMVRVSLEVISVDPEDQGDKSADELATRVMSTIVYMPRSWGLKQHKEFNNGSLKW